MQNSHDGHQKSCRYAKGNSGMHSTLDIGNIFRPEILGNNHTGSRGDAAQESNQLKNKAARRADSCQGAAAQEISYNQGIDCIVELLKQIAQ